ncbi:TRAP transporter fused permease subunit [Allorhizobium sp. BGMRC 0089]|uniref:TRAP transporter permease n=1 Tax=Allorhizobium sonneratiae TaxID=2934936 RepID=UPI0020332785|nr:TRAP transporter fused permease subunit [Allorhizobium sonneratiae]MCM2293904.1 TRAP transporter fused permease subunit [Allorhizobium sonneratiae]
MITYSKFHRLLVIALSLFYLAFLLKQFFWPDAPMLAVPVHVFLALALTILVTAVNWSGRVKLPGRALEIAMVAVCLLIAVHFVLDLNRLETRLPYIDEVFGVDKLVFVVGVLILFEAVRRTVGWSLLAMIAVFLAYAAFGYLVPGPLGFSGFNLSELTDIMTMNTDGLFGVTSSTAINFVFYFIMFGAIFAATGGGQLFIDIAMMAAGRLTGGAAKAALIGSALFGTISGSAVSNVAAVGVLTIPLMRRAGYTGEEAAATEAIGSTGGQLMPPVMGIAAFVMADLMGIPYTRIALAGIIPALAFYGALFLIVDLRARKTGAGSVSIDTRKLIAPIMPRIHLLIGPVLLLVMLFAGYSAPFAAFYASVAALLAPLLRAATRYSFSSLFEIAVDVPRQMALLSVPLCAIGIIMASATQSNLALKFVSGLAVLGGGNLYLSLILIVIGCLIMGMGLPTVAAYIIGSVMFVPALVNMGIDRLAANFFVMFFCVLSMVTPPVALASFAAAGVAQANTMKTAMLATGMGAVSFLIPFGFVQDPVILWNGPIVNILLAFFGTMCATAAWAAAIQGFMHQNLSLIERLVFLGLCIGIVLYKSLSPIWWVLLAAFWVMMIWCFIARQKIFGDNSMAKRRAATAHMDVDELMAQRQTLALHAE